jgi:hypothetical protein
MKSDKLSFALSSIALLMILTGSAPVYAFDDEISHPKITTVAVKSSNLENYISQNFGGEFSEGLDSAINGKAVLVWLQKGSTDEDRVPSMCRASNHFHDPTKPWDQSSVTDLPLFIRLRCYNLGWTPRYSNITWATGQVTRGGEVTPRTLAYGMRQDMGWDDARWYYYSALTAASKIEREAAYGLTFQAMGQVMHLLQDMAVPAHTRNDFTSHLTHNGILNTWLATGEPVVQPYELYVKDRSSLIESASQNVIVPAFTNRYVTDYWDTDGNQMPGLAEFSNSNYFSDSTIPTNYPTPEHTYSFPTINSASYEICEDYVEGSTTDKAKYVMRRNRTGCDKFARVSLLNPMVYMNDNNQLNANIAQLKLVLDNNVHNTYAKELLPRAVGYSAGLLNYFFRGTLEITQPDRCLYGIIDGAVLPQQFTKIKAKVRNTTPGEAISGGILQAVARYRKRIDYQPDLSADPPGAASREANFSYSVSAAITLTVDDIAALNSATPKEFTFNFTASPIPAGVTDLHLQVVFKGTLGSEADTAIAVGMKDIGEPQHHVYWNATDRFYLDRVLRTGSEIRNTPALLARVDHNNDGIPDELIDPYHVRTAVAYCPIIGEASTVNVLYPFLPPGRFGRILTLTDPPPAESYLVAVSRTSFEPPDLHVAELYAPRVENQEDASGSLKTTQVYTFRDITMHSGSAYARYYPDFTGLTTAPWPSAAGMAAYPADTIDH